MTNTVDKREIEQFSLLSNQWWNKSGPFSALHKMSNARIEFIKTNAVRIIDHLQDEASYLCDIKCLGSYYKIFFNRQVAFKFFVNLKSSTIF